MIDTEMRTCSAQNGFICPNAFPPFSVMVHEYTSLLERAPLLIFSYPTAETTPTN